MASGHRTQIKRARNAVKDTRPHAKLSYARIPVQKACIVMDAIRGKDVETACAILEYNPKYASSVILKLLNSAIANAENNLGMNASDLYVAECRACDGPIMKRIQPRAQGRAYRINKRMCNLYITLDEKEAVKEGTLEDLKKEEEEKTTAQDAGSETVSEEASADHASDEAKKEE